MVRFGIHTTQAYGFGLENAHNPERKYPVPWGKRKKLRGEKHENNVTLLKNCLLSGNFRSIRTSDGALQPTPPTTVRNYNDLLIEQALAFRATEKYAKPTGYPRCV
ncbi:hypothetical protein HDF10_003272 [Edaphobacter lichenicola]|uniref:Uncharacterized protein n=1 Tax=Tunturiibacter lichenicola TaxID=2051959 RepID=A0A7W8JA94_9BACT|nr:hypothetical protein [Edaphobacter lichenicola]